MQKSNKKQNANHVGATSSRPHFEGMTLKNNQRGITLIALIITIVLNCSCLAMVVEKKIDKIIGIEKGRNLLYNRLCN